MKSLYVLILLLTDERANGNLTSEDNTISETKEFLKSLFYRPNIQSENLFRQIFSSYNADVSQSSDYQSLKDHLNPVARKIVQGFLVVDRSHHGVFESRDVNDKMVA